MLTLTLVPAKQLDHAEQRTHSTTTAIFTEAASEPNSIFAAECWVLGLVEDTVTNYLVLARFGSIAVSC